MSSEHEHQEKAAELAVAMLPAVPEELGLDPVLLALLRCASFLDLSGDESVNAELAGEVLEHVGMYVQRLSDERLDAIQADLEALESYGKEQGWPEDVLEFVRDFLYNCGFGEDESGEPIGTA